MIKLVLAAGQQNGLDCLNSIQFIRAAQETISSSQGGSYAKTGMDSI
jgi:hypothetical protein